MNGALSRWGPPRAQDPLGVSVPASQAVETASLFGLGMRRLAADIGLIRLMIYYGTPEDGGPREHSEGDGHDHGAFDPAHPERSWGGGHYPELEARGKRILDLDPAFSFPALFTAGALAFNLNRPEEALRVLEHALARDPRNFQYHAYVGAVGFHRKGDAAGVIRLLEPALSQPECPSMIKHLVAFLYRRSGQKAKAAKLYREVYESSRDAGYRGLAEKALQELGELR